MPVKLLQRNQIINTLERYIETHRKAKNDDCRAPNFPEPLSESMVMYLIIDFEKIPCCFRKDKGDLVKGGKNKKNIEIKSFISDGPSSFGPTEEWDELYFLDSRKFQQYFFRLYRINIKNNDDIFQNILVNKSQTFKDQCLEKRRPRISFDNIEKQISKYIEVIYEGDIREIFETNNNDIIEDFFELFDKISKTDILLDNEKEFIENIRKRINTKE